MASEVGHGADRSVRDARALEPRLEVGAIERREAPRQHAVELRPVLDTDTVGAEALVVGERRIVEDVGREPAELLVVLHRDQNLRAAASGEGAIRRDGRMVQSHAGRLVATIGVLQIRHVHPVAQHMIERHRHVPALAGALARIEGPRMPCWAVLPAAMSHTETPTRAMPASLPVMEASPLSAWTRRS